jgi:hypothetical protein
LIDRITPFVRKNWLCCHCPTARFAERPMSHVNHRARPAQKGNSKAGLSCFDQAGA